MTMRPLRDHQVQAMTMLRASLARGVTAPMLAAPTGAGKTRIAAEIVLGAQAKGKRVLIIVPVLALVDQTVAALEAEGIRDIGVIQGFHVRTDCTAGVQVASVQTLQRRKMPPADVILVDEAHRWFQFYGTMIADAKRQKTPVIGLSATPWARNLGKHFEDLLQVATTEDLIKAGYLAQFKVFAPSHPDLEGVRTVKGDYHEQDLSEAMNKPHLVADVVSTWIERGERRPTLCFGVDRAHAKQLQTQFIAAGVATGYIDAYTTSQDRADIRAKFHSGELEVVCNVACLTTGVDWDVRCLILARPTKSEMLFVQIVGRGLRLAAPGASPKDHLLILDHSDTHLRLGMVTDIHHAELDDGKKQNKQRRLRPVPKPKECPQCHFLRPAKVAKCPSCGFKPERQVGVEIEDGDLVEFRRTEKATIERKAEVYGMLKTIAKRRGYREGWASNKYREFFKVWPNAVAWAPQREPDPDIVGWVRSRDIAFAKGRERHTASVQSARTEISQWN